MAASGQFWISIDDRRVVHVYGGASGTADEAADIKTLCEMIVRLAGEDETQFRIEPTIESEKDFEADVTKVRGRVRFSFYLGKKGPKHLPKTADYVGFGAAA